MGHVGVSNQLRDSYRVDTWLRNFKWWHSLFWWGVQVLLVNSYIIYQRCLEEAGNKPASHYEYQKAIALAMIDPQTYGRGLLQYAD